MLAPLVKAAPLFGVGEDEGLNEFARITEDDEARITEDGETRVTEEA